jgi:hypothetical protein
VSHAVSHRTEMGTRTNVGQAPERR